MDFVEVVCFLCLFGFQRPIRTFLNVTWLSLKSNLTIYKYLLFSMPKVKKEPVEPATAPHELPFQKDHAYMEDHIVTNVSLFLCQSIF